MTEVATTLRSCYLAGPMRGFPEFNFPEFHKQTAWLRARGWKVFSPAERDEADPVLNGDWAVGKEHGLDYYMQFDLAAVCQTDAVVLMSGWENSQGARMEAAVAVEIGHPVFEIVVEPVVGRQLLSVNPQYVREVFFIGGQGVIGEDSQLLYMTQVMEPPEDPGFQNIDFEAYDEERERQIREVASYEFAERAHVVSETEDCGCNPERVTVPAEETISSGRFKDLTYETMQDEVVDLDQPDDEAKEMRQFFSDAYDPSLSEARKAMPIATGVLDYFPAALLEVSRVSKAGNDKHNPGQPLHHARGKSTDHADALLRHLIDRGTVDEETGMRHSAEMAWRALALLQQELEDGGAPLARGARLPDTDIDMEGLA